MTSQEAKKHILERLTNKNVREIIKLHLGDDNAIDIDAPKPKYQTGLLNTESDTLENVCIDFTVETSETTFHRFRLIIWANFDLELRLKSHGYFTTGLRVNNQMKILGYLKSV